MKLLLIEPSPHGGLLHYIAQLADALAKRGHSVDLLATRDNELVDRPLTARMRADLPRLPVQPGAAPTGLAYRVRQAKIALALARSWAQILVRSRTGGHDAVITGADVGMVPTALASFMLTMIPGRPTLVRICHNARTYNRWGGNDIYKEPRVLGALLARADRRYDLTVFPGERARAEYEQKRPTLRSVIVPHGDERLFGEEAPPPATEERILFFGDQRKVKGLPVLLDAFDQLVQRRPGVRLTIAGSPHPNDLDPEPVRRWATGHGDRVELIDDYVPMDAVAGIFARARVVVTPYIAGSQSGVIALAQTMARAVVTTDVGELGDVVGDDRSGRVVAPNDPDALATALEAVVIDPELAERYGAEGRRRGVDARGWESGAETLERAVAPLVEERRTSR